MFFFLFSGRGNLSKPNDFLKIKKSKLCLTLRDLLFSDDQHRDELSYFVLFMDNNSCSNKIKFLLDLNTFEKALQLKRSEVLQKCMRNCAKSNEMIEIESLSASSVIKNLDEEFGVFEEAPILNQRSCNCLSEYYQSNKLITLILMLLFFMIPSI